MFVSCENQQDFSPSVRKSVDLFFLENHNRELLQESNIQLNKKLSISDKNLLKILQAGAYTELNQYDSAQQIFSGLDKTEIKNDEKLDFWYKSMYGLFLFRNNNYPEAYTMLKSVIDDSYDNRAKALSLRIISRIHFSMGNVIDAMQWIAQSSELFNGENLSKSVAINHKIIGRYYASKNEVQKAQKHFEKAEQGLLLSKDSLEIYYIYINITDLYIRKKEFETARVFILKAQQYISKESDNQALSLLYNNFGEIDYQLQNYDSSISHYKKTLLLPTGYSTEMLRRGNAKLGIARSLKQKNQIEEAIIIAEQALEIANEFDVKDLSKDANKLLSVIYAKAGRYNEAYQFSKILLDVKPDNELVKSTEKLYQSTIELLRLNQKAEQMNIERKVYIILIIVGIVFTIFLVVYSIYTLRLFRSRNTVLKALVKKNLQQLDDERKLKEALNQQLSSKKLTRKSTDEEKDSLLFKEFTKWLTEGKHYLRKDLTVEMVAKELNTNREYLSRAVSSQQIHFNELINKYRVEEVIKIFSDKTDRRNKYNMNIIASDSGFKSMSVFIEAFRKQTGMNPALFRDTVKVNDLLKNNYLIDNI